MTRIKIEDAYEPVEIDLWGDVFVSRDLTKSTSKQATGIQKQIAEATTPPELPDPEDESPEAEAKRSEREAWEADEDVLIDLNAQLMDLRFVPVDGGRAKPSTAIKRKWEQDKLSLDQLVSVGTKYALARAIAQEEALEALVEDRPT